ncbi:unnamed protein product [Prorocentrum cordatum]|uniref:C3H1-type domain-containing protein n=1 Tax=Prorocentrum cordatum TaxID=2364126 RepID=A0ABN9TW71_9DINO|nr:unnamed protein product [Polarella glacialis]
MELPPAERCSERPGDRVIAPTRWGDSRQPPSQLPGPPDSRLGPPEAKAAGRRAHAARGPPEGPRKPPAEAAEAPHGGGSARGAEGGEGSGTVPSWACKSPPGALGIASLSGPKFCSSCSVPSDGSIGHPTFCRLACALVRSGTRCPRGPECAWCHEPSCKSRRYLDKQTRSLFREMDDLTKISVVWPALKSKVDELGFGSVATRALDKWRGDVMNMPEFAGQPLDVRLLNPYCVEGLRRLRLTDLCARPILPEGVVERTERLLTELRVFERMRTHMMVSPVSCATLGGNAPAPS